MPANKKNFCFNLGVSVGKTTLPFPPGRFTLEANEKLNA